MITTLMSIFYSTTFSSLSDFHATVVVRMFNCRVMLVITRFDQPMSLAIIAMPIVNITVMMIMTMIMTMKTITMVREVRIATPARSIRKSAFEQWNSYEKTVKPETNQRKSIILSGKTNLEAKSMMNPSAKTPYDMSYRYRSAKKHNMFESST